MNPSEFGIEYLHKNTLENREELLKELGYLKILISGRIDVWFCNHFLAEAVQLLVNSIYLMESGYFDCAFYSVRQSAETMNNMLYLASSNQSELTKWLNKNQFPTNARVKNQLETLDSTYQEFTGKLSVFFDDFDGLIRNCHKIIHKQGFDTFYMQRHHNAEDYSFDENEELKFFDKLLRYSICRLYIFFIILDPVSLILADENLNSKLHFDPLTEPVNLEFIKNNYPVDLVALIKSTDFYRDLVEELKDKEDMNPYVYGVIREQYFDLAHLDEINLQKHLLNLNQQFMLLVLQKGIKISCIYTDTNYIFPYYTSIPSNYSQTSWSSNEFDAYLTADAEFNLPYNGVYISYVTVYDTTFILQHNVPLSEIEIPSLLELTKQQNAQYKEFLSMFNNLYGSI